MRPQKIALQGKNVLCEKALSRERMYFQKKKGEATAPPPTAEEVGFCSEVPRGKAASSLRVRRR